METNNKAKTHKFNESRYSLTGSRKVVEMMCRLGHCASYHTVTEIENKMTIKATKSVKATPFGMSLNASTATGVAWDNFDRFVETKSGKDTLQDTVGIAYQVPDNSRPSILENSQEGQNSNENTKLKKKKRSYSHSELTITPYKKKPKFAAHGMLELNDARRLKYEKICDRISSPQKYDFLWMADFMFNDNYTIPVWVE